MTTARHAAARPGSRRRHLKRRLVWQELAAGAVLVVLLIVTLVLVGLQWLSPAPGSVSSARSLSTPSTEVRA